MPQSRVKWQWTIAAKRSRVAPDPTLTDLRPCPICNSSGAEMFQEFDRFQFFTDSATHSKAVSVIQARCLNCHTLYMNPCYSRKGFQILFAEAGMSYGATPQRIPEQVQWLTKRGLASPAELLDIGCFEGDFLAALPRSGRRVGVDIDAPAIYRARSIHEDKKIEFVLGDFEDFQYDRQPDVITMFHVLEHLRNPVETLSRLRQLAHIGTRLVLEVPILELGFTNDINGFFSVQHLTHFSRHTLRLALSRSGWKVIEEFDQESYNGHRVIASPAEDSSPGEVLGNEKDAQLLLKNLRNWNDSVRRVQQNLDVLPRDAEIAVWGAGLHSEFLFQTTDLFTRPCLLFDSDPLKQGQQWRGVPILTPETLAAVDPDYLVISSYGNQSAILNSALQNGVRPQAILPLYDQVDVY